MTVLHARPLQPLDDTKLDWLTGRCGHDTAALGIIVAELRARAPRRPLRHMSETHLLVVWTRLGGDDAIRKMVLDECRRRDVSAADTRWWSDMQARHMEAAHAQYLAADEVCRGNLLSAEGKTKVADPFPALWLGREDTARRLASEELRQWWDGHGGRITVSRIADDDKKSTSRDLLEQDYSRYRERTR